ncbi:LLM class flavin-dependent oxidoreductase [Nocardia suismassiliense]|uniref:LLM class flavin-dependent oxidoreductase n=1 Tax=Nocardia suismassiliense TaxID=2077092 RepID=A0ABW6R0A3_9NOCA
MSVVLFTRLTTASSGGATGRTAFVLAHQRARAAQLAGIDALLLDDRQSVKPGGPAELEAGTLAAALAVVTTGIGLVPAICAQHLAPYHVARLLATLDHLSGGRAGWELRASTEDGETANYHGDGPAPVDRQLSRAAEFTDVLCGLWDSFDDDAFLRDRASGVYFLPERLHTLDHRGGHFEVAGPLNIARAPQGYPVLVRRADSPGAVADAGRVADVVIVPADQASEISGAVIESALGAGRARTDVVILLEQVADTPVDQLIRLTESDLVDGFSLLPPADRPVDDAFTSVLNTAITLRRTVSGTQARTLRARLGLRRPIGKRPAA